MNKQGNVSMPSITEKVNFLRQAAAYPFGCGPVTVKETHMSWVFMVNAFVFKLKKPVINRLFDFTRPEARLQNCQNEVELNKRLAKDIYLGVIPLSVDENGMLALEGKGIIVDWLVKMKRLPEEQMLAWQISHKTVNETQIKRTAVMLAEFYRCSAAIKTDAGGYLQKIHDEILLTAKELINPQYHIPITEVEKIKSVLLKYLGCGRQLFEKRVLEGKIIEGHGDLRPEHVFLGEPPAIIDCLEFNRNLRIGDIAEELSYLAMECEAMGNSTIGEIFLETNEMINSDVVTRPLIQFYKIKKALLRVYLVIRHIAEPEYASEPRWRVAANTYLQLANSYIREL